MMTQQRSGMRGAFIHSPVSTMQHCFETCTQSVSHTSEPLAVHFLIGLALHTPLSSTISAFIFLFPRLNELHENILLIQQRDFFLSFFKSARRSLNLQSCQTGDLSTLTLWLWRDFCLKRAEKLKAQASWQHFWTRCARLWKPSRALSGKQVSPTCKYFLCTPLTGSIGTPKSLGCKKH